MPLPRVMRTDCGREAKIQPDLQGVAGRFHRDSSPAHRSRPVIAPMDILSVSHCRSFCGGYTPHIQM